MKFIYNGVLLQEVPNEISLGLTLLGCNRHCPNCHSQQYWDIYLDTRLGEKFTFFNVCKTFNEDKVNLKNSTCLCFFGGDWNLSQFYETISKLKNTWVFGNKKYCWYTGMSKENLFELPTIMELFDYIKYGSYVEELGSIDKPTSNQKFIAKKWVDKTNLFRRNYEMDS